MRFGLRFHAVADNRRSRRARPTSVILSSTAFGQRRHGRVARVRRPAFALSFGYTMNKQGRGVLLNPRGQALVMRLPLPGGRTVLEPTMARTALLVHRDMSDD